MNNYTSSAEAADHALLIVILVDGARAEFKISAVAMNRNWDVAMRQCGASAMRAVAGKIATAVYIHGAVVQTYTGNEARAILGLDGEQA